MPSARPCCSSGSGMSLNWAMILPGCDVDAHAIKGHPRPGRSTERITDPKVDCPDRERCRKRLTSQFFCLLVGVGPRPRRLLINPSLLFLIFCVSPTRRRGSRRVAKGMTANQGTSHRRLQRAGARWNDNDGLEIGAPPSQRRGPRRAAPSRNSRSSSTKRASWRWSLNGKASGRRFASRATPSLSPGSVAGGKQRDGRVATASSSWSCGSRGGRP